MKILIDAFNLGLKEGTGVATYARELSKTLHVAGHDVYPVYGLRGVGKIEKIAWSNFIQSLATRGEPQSGEIASWLSSAVRYLGPYLCNYPIKVREIIKEENDCSFGHLQEKLPQFSRLFNCEGIYRTCQAYAFFSKRLTKISLPSGVEGDLLHLTCPLPLKLTKKPTVMTFHDLIPLTLPYSTEMNLRHYFKMTQASLKAADLIFSVSEHSKQDLMRILHIPEKKIHVTHQAVEISETYKNLDSAYVKKSLHEIYDLEYKKYFLFYGTIEPKKNVLRILEAFSHCNSDYPIVIVGKDGWLYRDVANFFANNPNPSKFRRIQYAFFSSLMNLLKGAKGFVFPSLYEGFGLPVLEAMQMGCPVITSNQSSLPEVGGDAVHYVDPLSTQEITTAIDKFVSDEAYTDLLITKGFEQASKFSPAIHAQKITEGYNMVL